MPYFPNEYPFYAVSIGGTSKCDGYICIIRYYQVKKDDKLLIQKEEERE